MTHESGIVSSRYNIGKKIGQGSWGIVYAATDSRLLEKEVAIKVLAPTAIARRQMEERGVDLEQAVLKEANSELIASRHIIPRKLEFDDNGKPLIVMPLLKKFLDQRIAEYDDRLHLGHGLSEEDVLGYLADIATGLRDLHESGRIHGDLAPKNIALTTPSPGSDERRRALIGDLGSSTVIAWNHSGKRDNLGSAYVRAPENFKEGSTPTRESDVWAFGALAYRLCTGKYPLEDELENAKDPQRFMTGLEPAAIDAIIKGKIDKNVPKKMRRLIKTCLIGDERRRFARHIDLVGKVDDASRSTLYQAFQSKAKPYMIGAAAAAIFGAMFGFGSSAAKYESKEHYAPAISRIVSTPTMPAILVQSEELTDLPPMVSGGVFSAMQFVENHRERLPQHLAIFTGTYGAAITGGIDDTTQFQEALLSRRIHPAISKGFPEFLPPEGGYRAMAAFANAIAVTYDTYMSKPTFDLEDFCVEARYGPSTLALAKKYGGDHFTAYIDATTPDGKRIFSEEDERMLKTWLYALR